MILALVASACGGVVERFRAELAGPAAARGWSVAVTLTPVAWTWFDAAGELEPLQGLADLPVRSAGRLPGEPKPYPMPDAFVCCPASANTVAKLALGIADNQALTAACEGLGSGRPMLVVPSYNEAQAAHPAFAGYLRALGKHLREPRRWTELLDELGGPGP